MHAMLTSDNSILNASKSLTARGYANTQVACQPQIGGPWCLKFPSRELAQAGTGWVVKAVLDFFRLNLRWFLKAPPQGMQNIPLHEVGPEGPFVAKLFLGSYYFHASWVKNAMQVHTLGLELLACQRMSAGRETNEIQGTLMGVSLGLLLAAWLRKDSWGNQLYFRPQRDDVETSKLFMKHACGSSKRFK